MGYNQTKLMLSQYFHNVCYKTNLTLVDIPVPSVVFFFHFLLKSSFLTSPSPFLSLATISFPLVPLSLFLRSALLLIFCPTHEVL